MTYFALLIYCHLSNPFQGKSLCNISVYTTHFCVLFWYLENSSPFCDIWVILFFSIEERKLEVADRLQRSSCYFCKEAMGKMRTNQDMMARSLGLHFSGLLLGEGLTQGMMKSGRKCFGYKHRRMSLTE